MCGGRREATTATPSSPSLGSILVGTESLARPLRWWTTSAEAISGHGRGRSEPHRSGPKHNLLGAEGATVTRPAVALWCERMRAQLAEVDGARDALALLDEAYGSRLTRSGRSVEHPMAVADCLLDAGRSAPVILGGLLHDVLEDTEVTYEELRARVGDQIAELVAGLTEDASIAGYRERKAALRAQALGAGPDAAEISLADKLAKLRGRDDPPRRRKMQHYQATLDAVESRYGESILSRQLRAELERLGGRRS